MNSNIEWSNKNTNFYTIINVRTPSLIIKLGRRFESSGGSNGPRRIDGPDPDPFRSPTTTFFGASDGLLSDAFISGNFAAAESYWIINSINIVRWFNNFTIEIMVHKPMKWWYTNTLTILFRFLSN